MRIQGDYKLKNNVHERHICIQFLLFRFNQQYTPDHSDYM